ncbi:MAG: TonB-dependent receptor plug domain-containing protein [Balneolaceae bacterium]|nr:TonB-dependent receptor plug domain-containing protein [Balneolaceae bacterium]
MKKATLLSIFALSLLFTACSSTGSSVADQNESSDRNVSENRDYYTSLADFLRTVPGVSVTGSGENVSIRMRGVNSFNTGVSPLYVIDGQAVGNSYSQANSIVDPRDIDHVRVLKGPETSSYGIRGANGVIEIVTKKT